MFDKGNNLNPWFNAVLWLNIIFSGIGLIISVIGLLKENSADSYVIGSYVSVCVVLVGLYRMLKEDKNGFYFFVAGCLLNAVVAFIQYANMSADDYGIAFSVARTMVFKVVWTSLAKIVFIMLSLILGKIIFCLYNSFLMSS